MGGNALKTVKIVRLEREEFENYTKEVIEKLSKKLYKITPLKYYKNKPNFGDLDLLILKPKPDKKELMKFLEDEFNTKEMFFNGDVVSFDYKNFQIDLIFTPLENYETSEFFFSFNDLNNLIGRVANNFGLKFGFDGLSYILRKHHGGLKRRILISKNPKKIYNFLGYDYSIYKQGFNEIQDIFDFVTSGKYFNKNIFAYENLNHQNRTRNKKRKVYQAFIDYLENSKINNSYEYEKEEYYLHLIDGFFPEAKLIEKLEIADKEYHHNLKLKEKFNGKIIMNITPLIGKKLRTFIELFKLSRDIEFNKYVEINNNETIEKDIISFYQKEFI